jgi:hypothetical protein
MFTDSFLYSKLGSQLMFIKNLSPDTAAALATSQLSK